MMQHKKTLLALMLMGAAAAQADYQAQIDFSYATGTEEVDPDFGRDYDIDTDDLSLSGTFFFSRVSTANGPLDEAAFLTKASGVSLGYSKTEVDIERSGDYDADIFTLSGRFVLPGTNLILEAAYGEGDDDDDDVELWALGFGGYINDRITLILEYSKQEYDIRASDDSIERVGVRYRQLIEFGNGQSLAIEPYVATLDYFGEDGAELGIDAAYYINRSLGIKASLSSYGYDDDFGEYTEAHFQVGVDYYINENFRVGGAVYSVAGEYDDDFGDDVEIEGGGIEFRAALRF